MEKVIVRMVLATGKIIVMQVPNTDSYEETMETLQVTWMEGGLFALDNYPNVTARYDSTPVRIINMAHIVAMGY